jgi:DNA polymerase-4/DNA polymerase V
MMADLYQPNELYRACGIIAESITNAEDSMPDLFGVMKTDAKQASIFATMDDINKKYGRGTLRVAGAHVSNISGQRVRFMYPMIEAN